MSKLEELRKQHEELRARKKELLDRQKTEEHKILEFIVNAVKNVLKGNWTGALSDLSNAFKKLLAK